MIRNNNINFPLFLELILFLFLLLSINSSSITKDESENNKILNKTERLSNIIYFEEASNFNLISTLSNQMILEIINKNKSQRIFYSLNSNGSNIFENFSENIIQVYKQNISNIYKNELIETLVDTIVINVKQNNNKSKKEYIISILSNDLYIEIFDHSNFSNHNSFNFLPEYEIECQISSSLNYNDIVNNTSYFIFISITKNNENIYNLSLFKYIFYEEQNKINFNLILKQNLPCSKGKIISCFITEKNIISCFYLNTYTNYTITLFDTNFIVKNNIILKYHNDFIKNNFYFFKSIYLKNEIGIYLFFSDDANNTPIILIKNLSNVYSIRNVLSLCEEAKLYDYDFNNEIDLNDLVKIS